MLKYQKWFGAIWLAVVVLYCQGWSTLNMPLEQSLLLFLIIAVATSLVMAAFASPVPLLRIRWKRKRKPIVTALIVIGFVADWGYRKEIPILSPYQGFDTSVTEQGTLGIPVFHVVVIAVAVFYAMYLQYLWLSDSKVKNYLFELIAILLVLLLNNSRGYVVFSLFSGVLLFAAFNKRRLLFTKISVLLLLLLGVFGIIFFISVAGNIRSGYNWNDCSYIETIGYYKDYPNWLTKHFMWFYTYATSPLANLNLNCSLNSESFDLLGILHSFLPEQISNSYLLTNVRPVYIVQHLNACTGFVTFACSAGTIGLYVALAGTYVYYTIIKFILRKFVVLQTFGNALLCFLAVAFIFFNCFTTSAICYIPLFLIVASIYLHRRLMRGDIVLITEDDSLCAKR